MKRKNWSIYMEWTDLGTICYCIATGMADIISVTLLMEMSAMTMSSYGKDGGKLVIKCNTMIRNIFHRDQVSKYMYVGSYMIES